MSEDGEKKKKKKKDKKKGEEPEEAPEPPKEEPPKKKSKKKSSKKKSQFRGSGVFSLFSEKMLMEFKEGFSMIDHDRDGVIGKEDLRHAFDIIGIRMGEAELDQMISEATHSLTFTMFLTMFSNRMSGEADEDDVIIRAFKAFDTGNGGIDDKALEDYLSTWGEKYTPTEVKEIFPQLPRLDEPPHPNYISVKKLCGMFTSKVDEEEATATETGDRRPSKV